MSGNGTIDIILTFQLPLGIARAGCHAEGSLGELMNIRTLDDAAAASISHSHLA